MKTQNTSESTMLENTPENIKNEELINNKENENAELIKEVHKYQQGDELAFEFIFKKYKKKIERAAFQYESSSEDVAQELCMVLMKAAKDFKSNSNVRFNTYFWKCAQNHLGTQKIRQNAKKRSGAKEIEVIRINPETGEKEISTEIVKTKVTSLQTKVNNTSSEGQDTELLSLIENKSVENEFKNKELMICLDDLYKNKKIKDKEMTAIKMILNDDTLYEIGQELGGITAPAVHLILRRLGKNESVKNILLNLLQN